MLRSVFTPNRTACNRVRDETRHNQKPFAGLRASAARSVARPRHKKIILNAFGVRLIRG